MTSPNPQPDAGNRLYDLLPVIYRLRDAERGYPLRGLLDIIAEQVGVIEADIDQQYDNWFIETAADWVVPYIGDLVGYVPVSPGEDGAPPPEARILTPRADVANTIAFRQRRGTVSVLDDLAAAVARWPSQAIEYFRLLAWTQNLNFPQTEGARARLVSLASASRLDLIDSPFDPFARTVDVRRISSNRTQGRFNIPHVGEVVWRLRLWPVTRGPAFCVDASSNSYAFSALGNDAPLYNRPPAQHGHRGVTNELDAPIPIRRRALAEHDDALVGEGKALAIWTEWAGFKADEPVPSERLIAADLTDWHYAPPRGHIAVDPVLGRLRFPTDQLPRRNVSVSYHYGFSAAMGGGEYPRRLRTPADAMVYPVGEHATFARIGFAIEKWKADAPETAIIEIADSRAYVEPIEIELAPGQSLELRAADGVRPLIRLLDWQVDAPDALTVTLTERSSLTLDGLLIAGRGLVVIGAMTKHDEDQGECADGRLPSNPPDVCGSYLTIRHSTLVPGWALDSHCRAVNPGKPSIELRNVRAQVTVEHSILGPISISEDEVQSDPIPVRIADSIVDAMEGTQEAIGAPEARHAHAVLTLLRTTVFGIVQVHAVDLAENSIFMDCVHVSRRQVGCMRYCHISPVCRTPRRFRCQPDLAIDGGEDEAEAAERLWPRFTHRHYGQPGYGQLSLDTAEEIRSGADDGAEMGAFHDLYQPQRLANLRARLDEYTPASMDAGILIAS